MRTEGAAELAEYRAHYCGVCKAIGKRYGPAERLALSYDCAFLAAFLSALGGGATYARGNCGPRCYRGKRPIANASPALDYAADVNVLLAWYKAADDLLDEKRVSSLASRAALRPAYKKAARRHPQLDAELAGHMERLRTAEREKTASTDEPSDAFGQFLSAVIRHAPTVPESEKAACGWMFYNIGKWVYLIDAWDDREKDRKSGGYNPFVLTGMERETAGFLMNITLAEAGKAYDLITIDPPNGLIDNVMQLGLRSVQRRVLQQEGACCGNERIPQTDKGDVR
jgi:hypothetical protein